MTLVPAQQNVDALAAVLPEGKIAYDGEIYNMPSESNGAAAGGCTNGWTFWLADTHEGRFTLAALRDKLMA